MFQRVLRVLSVVAIAGSAAFVASASEPKATASPDPQEIVDRVIKAAEGDAAFSKLGVLEIVVREEETRNDGSSKTNNYTLYVDAANLSNVRKELPPKVVIGRSGKLGWATNDGKLDERPQTAYMANGVLNQTIFPLLLPYSLRMDGVWVKEIQETTWEGREVWLLAIPFAKGFFASAAMTTTWAVVVAKDDYSVLAASFIPPAKYRQAQSEGIIYRFLKATNLDGVALPAQIFAVGIKPTGQESGGGRVTKIEASIRGPWEPTLFMHPKRLEELEEEN